MLLGLCVVKQKKKVYVFSSNTFVNIKIFNTYSTCSLFSNIQFWCKVSYIFFLTLSQYECKLKNMNKEVARDLKEQVYGIQVIYHLLFF